MSGIEIVGIVLGVFPLAVSAMEHYQDTRTAASTFWKIRRAYRKDVRNVKHCQTIFTLHIEELLQPLVKIDLCGDENICADLLQSPGSNMWRDAEVEKALQNRLRKQYEPYKDTMEELLTLMTKLAIETRVEDVQFQNLLSMKAPVSAQIQLMQRANGIVRTTRFQAKRLRYSLTGSSRESLLQEVESYIRRLQDLLAAVDRLSKTLQEQDVVRTSPVSKALLHFWRHAERIYRLLRASMNCNCRSMHFARLWLRHLTDPQTNLSLLLLFAKGHHKSSPWVQEGLRIRQVEYDETNVTTSFAHNAPPIVVPSRPLATATISAPALKQISKAPRVTFSTPTISTPSAPDLSDEGVCKALAKGSKKPVCLGALVDQDEQIQYHVFPEQQSVTCQEEMVTATELLRPGAPVSPQFYRAYRYSVALKLVSAQIQFHSTQWLQSSWSLGDIRFPQRSVVDGGVDYSLPCLHADFESGTKGKAASTPIRDPSFWTLGVVLLELCFGTLLEDHRLFSDPNFARNPRDPLQRQAVALEWSEEVELEAGGDYACAVKWCLQQSPISGHTDDWRKDFAQNVLQPLQRCCESMKSGLNLD